MGYLGMRAARVGSDRRGWIADRDRPQRVLQVTAHPEQGSVTLSIWDGPTCKATHQVAMAEVPALVGALADGLAAAVPERPRLSVVADPPQPARAAWRHRARSLLHRFRP